MLAGIGTSKDTWGQRAIKSQRKVMTKKATHQVHARRVVHRTAAILLAAQKKIKEGKVYTGNFARAIAHQRFARKLYIQGNFMRSMHHSRRARRLALLAIQANHGQETADMAYEREDEKIMNDNPVSDADLDNELIREMPGYSIKDEDFVDAALTEIDLQDME